MSDAAKDKMKAILQTRDTIREKHERGDVLTPAGRDVCVIIDVIEDQERRISWLERREGLK